MTAQRAAEASRAHDGKGVSAAYWRDVERGYGGRRGQRVPTRASARALAAMARVVGVVPPQLAAAGREDAARVLEEIQRREQSATITATGGIALPSLTATGDAEPAVADAAEAMETAVVTAALPRPERLIWIELRRSLAATHTGAALFADPAQTRAWPAGAAPLQLTAEAIAALDVIPADLLLADPAGNAAIRLVMFPWQERVRWAAAGRTLLRTPTSAARRAG